MQWAPSATSPWAAAKRERLLRLLLLLRCVPKITQTSTASGHLRRLPLLSSRRGCELGGGWLGCLGVGRQPLRERSAFLCVVCAKDAGNVRVVFGVAVCLAVEEL